MPSGRAPTTAFASSPAAAAAAAALASCCSLAEQAGPALDACRPRPPSAVCGCCCCCSSCSCPCSCCGCPADCTCLLPTSSSPSWASGSGTERSHRRRIALGLRLRLACCRTAAPTLPRAASEAAAVLPGPTGGAADCACLRRDALAAACFCSWFLSALIEIFCVVSTTLASGWFLRRSFFHPGLLQTGHSLLLMPGPSRVDITHSLQPGGTNWIKKNQRPAQTKVPKARYPWLASSGAGCGGRRAGDVSSKVPY